MDGWDAHLPEKVEVSVTGACKWSEEIMQRVIRGEKLIIRKCTYLHKRMPPSQ